MGTEHSSEARPRAATERLHELRIQRDPASRPGSRRPLLWLAGGALLVIGFAAAYFLTRESVAAVRIATVSLPSARASDSVLDATGYVTARRQATVSAQVTGKVVEVLIEEGQQVEAGEILARLDDTTERAQLALAQAELDSARAALAETDAQLIEARRQHARLEELAQRQLASQRELDAAQAMAATLAARLETGREQVKVAERAMAVRRELVEQYVVRAPFAGVVVAKTAQPGEMISPISAGGGFTRTGIGTVVDMDSLEIEVDVNEAYIQRVYAGQDVTATLDAYPDWPIPARVIAVVPAADRQKATVKVRIGILEKDARILPDMGIKVAFLQPGGGHAESTSATPLVPRRAIRERNGARVVLIVEDGVVEERVIRVAEGSGADLGVLEGLTGGERVVVDGPDDLRAGMQVRIEQ